jgi:hypothetical protein
MPGRESKWSVVLLLVVLWGSYPLGPIQIIGDLALFAVVPALAAMLLLVLAPRLRAVRSSVVASP